MKAGKVLFQTCLACHQVGKEGQGIAPALDGSANRENEALLTAILDPDAAVESGYSVYRVNKSLTAGMSARVIGRRPFVAVCGSSLYLYFCRSALLPGGRWLKPV